MARIFLYIEKNEYFCPEIITKTTKKMRKLITLSLLSFSLLATAQTHVLDVNTKKLGAPVQPTMYGIFFEDINYAADGGLYAEMVKNRSFEFDQPLMGWRAYG